jgi:TRAP-type C4-dicarboxylate transport system substrate-binding protein
MSKAIDIGRAFAFILLVALAGCGREARDPHVYELTYASLYSQLHPYSRADRRWIEHVAALSDGRLRIKPFWGGAILSSEMNVIELRHGIVDIGMITPIYMRGGVPAIRAQGGFYSGVTTIEDQVTALQCLMQIDPTIERELAGLRVLAVQGGNFPGVLTANKPVRTLEDFAGLRLRVPNENFALFRSLGADPVSLPMSEVYSALAKGVIDGVVTPADALRGLHLAEVGKYFTTVRVSRGAYPARAISEQAWQRLPEELRDVLERSLDVWQRALTEEIARAEEGGLRFAIENRLEVIEFPPDQQALFDRQFAQGARENAASLQRLGVDGLAILEKAQAIVRKINEGTLASCGACGELCQ